jgi:bifunctional enzyme CysN/CysC
VSPLSASLSNHEPPRPTTYDLRPTADLLRLSTAGSVDDGKSTLIGRLLFDTREVFEDQLAAVERASRARGADYVNLALLTDGLRAEREQGITIDVAYRHFSTPRRRFILADTPGHVQYTRNMVTGTSTADLTVVLLDARRGVTEQTRRHLYVASLLRVPHVVVCVNKLDLLGYAPEIFVEVREELTLLVQRLGLPQTTFIPISALHGDNVTSRSANMHWYVGPTLLEYLERVPVTPDVEVGARFAVQWVVRPLRHDHHDYRGYAGQLTSGTLLAGDAVAVYPSGLRTRVTDIDTFDGPLEQASAPMSVVLRLEDDLDIARGDLICAADDPPCVGQKLSAVVCWLSTNPLRVGSRYALKHLTRSTRAVVQELDYVVDVNTAEPTPGARSLELNDIGRVRLRTLAPLAYDSYAERRATGSLILIDEATNETIAAGVIQGRGS